MVVVFVGLRWGSPSQQENSSHYQHVAAPALRSRTHVSGFALVVYQHDPDGTLIVLLGSRALLRGGAEADLMEPFNTKLDVGITAGFGDGVKDGEFIGDLDGALAGNSYRNWTSSIDNP